MMLLIIEGQARTGKTSLVLALVNALDKMGVPAFTRKSHKRDDYAWYMVSDVVPMALAGDAMYVLDRAHLSEIVYRAYEDNMSLEHYRDMMAVDRVLATAGALLVHVRAEPQELIERHALTGRPFEGDVFVLGEMFEGVVADSAIPTLVVDTTSTAPEKCLEDVIAFAVDGFGGVA